MNALTTTRNTTSISPRNTEQRALADLVASFANQVVRESDGTFWLEVIPNREQRRAIEQRRDQINRALRPASESMTERDRIKIAVTAALAGWINARSGNAEASVAGYVLHLQDLPAFAVERACQDIARGKVVGLSPDFPPSAARIHQIASEHLETLQAEAVTISHILKAKQQVRQTPEMLEHMKVVTAAWLKREDPKAQEMLRPRVESPLARAHRERSEQLAAKVAGVLGPRPKSNPWKPSPDLLAMYGADESAEEMA